jgi:hypothetical protein
MPIDVLVGMHLLTPEKVQDWRRGRIPDLERVINCNLTRLSRLLRILRFHVHDLNLVPSNPRHGKGRKQRLRFTKRAMRGLRWPTRHILFGLGSHRSIRRVSSRC